MSEHHDDPFVRSVLERLDVSSRRRDVVDRDARRAIAMCLLVGLAVLVWTFWPSGTRPDRGQGATVAVEPDLTAVWSRMRVPEGTGAGDETGTRSGR